MWLVWKLHSVNIVTKIMALTDLIVSIPRLKYLYSKAQGPHVSK